MWKVWGKCHFGPRFWKVREFYDSDQSTDNLQRGGGDSEGGGGGGGRGKKRHLGGRPNNGWQRENMKFPETETAPLDLVKICASSAACHKS